MGKSYHPPEPSMADTDDWCLIETGRVNCSNEYQQERIGPIRQALLWLMNLISYP
jgi:hypothetical protein